MPAGERIVSQGDFAYELFAILEGTARVEQDGEVVATLGTGDLCGEIGLLLTGRRTAAIVAETPVRMLALFDQTFRRLDQRAPRVRRADSQPEPRTLHASGDGLGKPALAVARRHRFRPVGVRVL